MKRVTSISATAVIRVFGLHLNTLGERERKRHGGKGEAHGEVRRVGTRGREKVAKGRGGDRATGRDEWKHKISNQNMMTLI